MILSAIALTPLSSVVENIDYQFFNTDRNFTAISAISSFEGVDYVEYYALQDTADVSVENDNLTFLTKSRTFDWLDTNLKNKFVHYTDNESVDISSTTQIKTNFLLTSPYKDTFDYNVIPLKSTQGTNGEYDYNKISSTTVSREYNAVYQAPNSNIILQYETNATPLTFKSDNYTQFFVPPEVTPVSIENAGFEKNGAYEGNCPANSDLIFIDQYDTNFNDQNFNGLPLCMWLSGNTWMERWYDPNNISQGNALLPLVNTTSAINPVVDRPASQNLNPKNKVQYLRHGPERNKNYINSLSAHTVLNVSSWTNRMKYNNIDIFAVSPISEELYDEANLDGTTHYHIPPTNELHDKNDMTVGMWVYQDKWDSGIDTQYFGNFSNGEGYGLFYNTGANSNLLTLPTESGMIYGFNPRGIKVFEKSITQSLSLNSAKIELITTDMFGVRWVYDSVNKKIYQLETDDIIKQVIDLPSTANITRMEVNEANQLYIFNDTTSPRISGFSLDGELIYSSSATTYNIFTFDLDNTLLKDYGDHLAVDSQNNILKINGANLYKNNQLFYHIGERSSALKLDSEDNIYILRKNRLLKIDSLGFKKFDLVYDIPTGITDYSQEMGFVKNDNGKTDYDALWLVFNKNNYVMAVNTDGKILKRINLKDVVNLRVCQDFIINVHGDFTNYDIKRKYSVVDNKIISSANPAISLNVNLTCGSNKKIIQVHSSPKLLQGWNHLSFTHQIKNDDTYLTLYINGVQVAQSITNGIYFIDYGSKVSPFILGGHSGKLGARNVERSLNNEGYFVGKINDLRIYNRTLDSYEIRALARNLYWNKWFDMIWFMPTPTTTQMEEIELYHLNRYKGHKSNRYNIRIKNLQIDDEATQLIIANTIEKLLPKISPVHTQLNEVIFD